MKVLNTVLNYKNLQVYQDTEMFSFTLDSVMVSRFPKFSSQIRTVIDFGTNNGIIPLIASRYSNAKFTGIEIQEAAVALARESIEVNGMTDRIKIVHDSIQNYVSANLHAADMVICNPPFFAINDKAHITEKSELLIPARHETKITLNEIVYNAAQALKNGGTFVIVHRAERFAEIMQMMATNKIVPKRIQFVYSKQNQKAKTVLIDGILNGNDGIEILQPIIAHNEDGEYSDQLKKWFED